jgi:hypothetical protein
MIAHSTLILITKKSHLFLVPQKMAYTMSVSLKAKDNKEMLRPTAL